MRREMNTKKHITNPLLLAAVVAALAAWTMPVSAAEPINVGGVEADGAGSVTGTVFFEGRQAKRKRIDVSADAKCASMHSDENPVLSKNYIFGENDDEKATLVNVFVYISKGIDADDYDAPDAKKLLDQEGCEYKPHVSGVMVGQTLTITNSDPTLHNVNMQSKENGSMNEGQPVKGMTKDVEYKNAEMGITFKCDVHPWMGAYVHDMEHPFYAVTQHDGSYTLEGLPPGKYTVTVRQEFKYFKPAKNDIEIEVKAGEAAKADFTFEPPKKN